MVKIQESLDMLEGIPLPEKTQSYTPVSHGTVLEKLYNKMYKELGKEPENMSLTLAKQGNQMFGSFSYKSDNSAEADMSVGFRNSYDKSLAVGLVAGSRIIVCSNLCFSGDVRVMRKHTTNVADDFEVLLHDTAGYVKGVHQGMLCDFERFKNESLQEELAASLLGQLFVTDKLLNTKELNIAAREWHGSEKFKDKNVWSLYNACTEALKDTHPVGAMHKYTKLHDFFTSRLEEEIA